VVTERMLEMFKPSEKAGTRPASADKAAGG